MGVTGPAEAKWAGPIVISPKKNRSVGFCVDCRVLNDVTVRDSYTFLRMDEYIDLLGDALIFITVDA